MYLNIIKENIYFYDAFVVVWLLALACYNFYAWNEKLNNVIKFLQCVNIKNVIPLCNYKLYCYVLLFILLLLYFFVLLFLFNVGLCAFFQWIFVMQNQNIKNYNNIQHKYCSNFVYVKGMQSMFQCCCV